MAYQSKNFRRELAVPAMMLAVLLMLGACGATPQMDARLKLEKEDELRRNMRLVQVAAEHFAADHGGDSYPVGVDDSFKTYFRGGVEGRTPAPVGLVNPFTGVNEFPLPGQISDPVAVRHGERFAIAAGAIEYSALENGRGYAIAGGAQDGKALTDIYNPAEVLVLTNVTH